MRDAAVLAVLAGAVAPADEVRFRALGQFPGAIVTYAVDCSGDGRTVVGYASFGGVDEVAWRWTEATGYQSLGTLGSGGEAYAANGDGSVIVGYSYTPENSHSGFRWTPGTGMQALPMYEVTDVSADGSLMIGLNVWRRVTGETGTFGFLGSTFQYTAMSGVSNDGRVVVGHSRNDSQFARAVRWTEAGGLQDLGVTTGNESGAEGVSGDGLVVVGQARDNGEFWRAFRWAVGQTQIQDLGTLGGPMSAAWNASYNGSVVVGTSLINSSSASNRAFRWTPQHGMEDLRTVAVNGGAGNIGPFLMLNATGVSDDGRTIVGSGIGGTFQPSQAFIVVFARTCSADIDGDGDIGTDADIEAFFQCLGGNCCFSCVGRDFDDDGSAGTDADIEAFFRVLAGGSC